ncbi:hypothetical protein [Tepidibacillus decaturensis]|uniref:Tail assembly chaperone n=1 Tax=Tepidibacillus decaturensis TaxID=1413211 RepID=A0A135L1J9_9BACI|nr:hypothetical protein [Tepidibacillus decaturensis]KXG42878.1 hypothetical protein U473_01660 [Tepidibacillus decaturensis]
MFSKNKPTKRIDLPEGNWVELQYLSKGQKDILTSELAGMFKKMNIQILDKDIKMNNDDINENIVNKVNEVEYKKLSFAIKAWSANDVEINEDSIKDLDEEVYEKILDEVNKMNNLTEDDVKNSLERLPN